jgi:predicted nucleic acid-binding protein
MIAVDTNVLIYACDQSDPRRQTIALDLIAASTDGVLLWQVASEFLSASRKLGKQGFTPTQAWNRLAEFRDLFPLVLPAEANLTHARELHVLHTVSLWDARSAPRASSIASCGQKSMPKRPALPTTASGREGCLRGRVEVG